MPSQTLALSQQQRLQMVLAPQLRQSLEMLQLPIMDLRTMIQQEIEQNPTIEEQPIDNEPIEIEPGDGETEKAEAMDFDKEFEALSHLDEEWREYFFQNQESQPYSSDADERRQFLLDSLPQRQSLQEHLLEQLQLTELEDEDHRLGEMIIGSIDDDGYLTGTLEELETTSNADLQRLEDILHLIQDFHPTGVGARDLRECLMLQLARLGKRDTLVETLVDKHLDKLGARRLTDLAKQLKISPEELLEATAFIATLDPKPGRIYSDEVATYVVAEIVVKKVEGKYIVIMDDDQLPHIRISRHYRRLLQAADSSDEVKEYVRDRIRAGAFLIKSIHQRQKTIFRIATEIVNRQVAFLDQGVSHLKPLTMAEIANAVEVHETTVSRAVNGKYMRTPRGIFEMKYFFTPGIKTADGSSVSNKTVKDMIATMVTEEDPAKPLSDQAILKKLDEEGIKIARRTIAKYRLVLKIPPSHMRKLY
ncbi:MAG: RNA polymerase factor sigma-54 [Kiritimatiellae bacterium]|nr:RNA polymerase factor sigma-54 [Kiritimatiellia bacterium]